MDQNSTEEGYNETSIGNYSNGLDNDEIEKVILDSQWQLHKNIVLVTLYVPLLVLAAVANILVIIVVVRYHYMRR
jgi:hypothetical protein